MRYWAYNKIRGDKKLERENSFKIAIITKLYNS